MIRATKKYNQTVSYRNKIALSRVLPFKTFLNRHKNTRNVKFRVDFCGSGDRSRTNDLPGMNLYPKAVYIYIKSLAYTHIKGCRQFVVNLYFPTD